MTRFQSQFAAAIAAVLIVSASFAAMFSVSPALTAASTVPLLA
ncbi:hypothetical protein [Altererythrobacter sp. Z27]